MKRLRLSTISKEHPADARFNRLMEEIESQGAEVQNIDMSDEKVIYVFYSLKEESE